MPSETFDHDRHQEGVLNFFRSGLGWPLDELHYGDILRIRECYERFWLRQVGDMVLATVGIQRWDDQTALLRRLYVLPTFKGRGICLRLLRVALDYVRTQSYRRVWLWLPLHPSPDAQRLYEHFGFKVVDSLPVPESAGKICMELKL